MSVSQNGVKFKPQSPLADGLMVLNAVTSVALAFFWSRVSGLLDAPLIWATGLSMAPHTGLFEQPFVMLWMLPLLCMCAGWLALKGSMPTLARMVGAFPVAMLTTILLFYYYLPLGMR